MLVGRTRSLSLALGTILAGLCCVAVWSSAFAEDFDIHTLKIFVEESDQPWADASRLVKRNIFDRKYPIDLNQCPEFSSGDQSVQIAARTLYFRVNGHICKGSQHYAVFPGEERQYINISMGAGASFEGSDQIYKNTIDSQSFLEYVAASDRQSISVIDVQLDTGRMPTDIVYRIRFYVGFR